MQEPKTTVLRGAQLRGPISRDSPRRTSRLPDQTIVPPVRRSLHRGKRWGIRRPCTDHGGTQPGPRARPRAAPSGAARGRACSPGFAGLACRGAGFAGGRLSQILRYAGFGARCWKICTSNGPGTVLHACPCTRTPAPRGRLTARFVWRKFWARDGPVPSFVGNWASPTKDPFQSSPGGRKKCNLLF